MFSQTLRFGLRPVSCFEKAKILCPCEAGHGLHPDVSGPRRQVITNIQNYSDLKPFLLNKDFSSIAILKSSTAEFLIIVPFLSSRI